MFKFLRKYNKMLLAIFGVLLMITFLIPQAFNRFSQQAAAHSGSIATVGDGEKVSNLEWSLYQRELQVLEKLRGVLPPLPGLGAVKSPEHWFLLVREASEAGLVPVIDQRDASATEMQQLMAITQEHEPDIINRAQMHYAGVAQLLALYGTGDLYSDRRLKAEAERLLHLVTARLVVVQPDADKSNLQPTEAQLQEQLAKYADKLPGEGEFGFGYKLPNRAKLEWLTIPVSTATSIVETSEAMDTVQQRLHWKRNPNKNLPPPPADGSATAIPDVVRSDLLNQLTRAKMDDIAKFAGDTLRLAQRGLGEKDGYFVLPDDWTSRQKALPQLAEELRTRFGIGLPEYSARGERWLTVDELATLPGIGRATTDKVGNTPVAFTDLVRAAHELGGHSTIIVQKGVAGPAVKDAEGNLYFFRITDTDAARPPANLDEVREQVVKDLKRQADYARVKASLVELESQARSGGLLQVAVDNNTIVQAPAGVYAWSEYWVLMMTQYRMPMTPQPANLPVVGADRKVIDAIIDRALALPRDVAVDKLPLEQRIFSVAADDKLAGLVVEIMAQQPLSKQSFDRLAQAGAIQQLVSAEEADQQRSIESAFAMDTMAKRNNFALKRESDESKAESEKPESTEPAKTAAVN